MFECFEPPYPVVQFVEQMNNKVDLTRLKLPTVRVGHFSLKAQIKNRKSMEYFQKFSSSALSRKLTAFTKNRPLRGTVLFLILGFYVH